MAARSTLAAHLVQVGRIDELQLRSALADVERWGGSLGEALVRRGFLTEEALLDEEASRLGLRRVQLTARRVEPRVLALIPEKLVRALHVFPVGHLPEHGRELLLVATAAPEDLAALDQIAFATGMRVEPVLASRAEIARAIDANLGARGPRPAAR